MALTVTLNHHEHWGRKRVRFLSVAFDSSYPTGGESLTATEMGLGSVLMVFVSPSAGYSFQYDYTNGKLLAYWGDNNNASDGPSVEVANTTNLSALNDVRVMVIGA